MKGIQWHTDAGHGWLKVPLSSALDGLNISEFSYIDATHAYLEEDCDARTFLEFMGINGRELPDVYDGDFSPIRNKARWHNPNYVSPFRKVSA